MTSALQPHPYLNEPVLYVDEANDNLDDTTIANALTSDCAPFKIEKATLSDGSERRVIRFRDLINAEKAYATVNGRQLSEHDIVKLWIDEHSNDTFGEEEGTVIVRLWPYDATFGQLFDLFRPCGPISSINCDPDLRPERGLPALPPIAVSYYDNYDAKDAINTYHCHEVQGRNIWVGTLKRWMSMLKGSYAARPPPINSNTGMGGFGGGRGTGYLANQAGDFDTQSNFGGGGRAPPAQAAPAFGDALMSFDEPAAPATTTSDTQTFGATTTTEAKPMQAGGDWGGDWGGSGSSAQQPQQQVQAATAEVGGW